MSEKSTDSPAKGDIRAKILILEDDFDFAEMLSESLEASGYDVAMFLEPEEALETALDPSVDLVVSDIQMPKQSGEEFVRQMRDERPELPIILISAYTRQHDLETLMALGVKRVMRKPFKQTDLLKEIEDVLEEMAEQRRQKAEEKQRLMAGAQLPEYSFPDTQGTLAAGHILSRQAAEDLWEVFQRSEIIFLSGPPGMELEPILGALRVWAGEDSLKLLEVRASDLFDMSSREMINRLTRKDDYGSIVVVQNLLGMSREGQATLTKMMAGEVGFFRGKAKSRFIFTVAAADLANSDIPVEEGLMELVYPNLVNFPPLAGRYSDIAHYARRILEEYGLADAGILTADGMAFLVQYDWPGNYSQLVDVLQRYCIQAHGQPLDRQRLLGLIDKTRRKATEFEPLIDLESILIAEQKKIFLQEMKLKKIPPEGILQGLGVELKEVPADFPSDLPLLYPELLREIEG